MKRVLQAVTISGLIFLALAVFFAGCKKEKDDPNGKIKGTASFPAGVSGDLSNAKISIYTNYDNWLFNQPIKFVGAVGAGASVTFEMVDVLPGNYYLDVWKDIDNSATWSIGDFVGWYGSGGLGSPALTEFQVVAGQTIDLNIQMFIIAKGNILLK